MKAVLIFVLCFAWHCGIIARAEDVPTDRVDNPTQESDLIALKAVIAALPKWSSGSGPESFQFERCVDRLSPDSEDRVLVFQRTICDHDRNADLALGMIDFHPVLLCSGSQTYQFVDGAWDHVISNWKCQLKEPVPADFMDQIADQTSEGPIIVDLPHYLSNGFDDRSLQVIRNRVTNSVVYIKKNKSWIEIRQRSPNDAEQLGCVLSEIMIAPMRFDRGLPNGRMSLRSFTTTKISRLRLHVDTEQMNLVVDPRPAPDAVFDKMQTLPLAARFFAFPDSASNTTLGAPLHRAATLTDAPSSQPRPVPGN